MFRYSSIIFRASSWNGNEVRPQYPHPGATQLATDNVGSFLFDSYVVTTLETEAHAVYEEGPFFAERIHDPLPKGNLVAHGPEWNCYMSEMSDYNIIRSTPTYRSYRASNKWQERFTMPFRYKYFDLVNPAETYVSRLPITWRQAGNVTDYFDTPEIDELGDSHDQSIW